MTRTQHREKDSTRNFSLRVRELGALQLSRGSRAFSSFMEILWKQNRQDKQPQHVAGSPFTPLLSSIRPTMIFILPVSFLESPLSKGQSTMQFFNTKRHNQERLLAYSCSRGNQSMNMQTVPFCFGLIDGVHLLPKPAVRKRTQR